MNDSIILPYVIFCDKFGLVLGLPYSNNKFKMVRKSPEILDVFKLKVIRKLRRRIKDGFNIDLIDQDFSEFCQKYAHMECGYFEVEKSELL